MTTNSTYYANVYMCSEQLGAKLWPAWRSRTVSSAGLENVACAGVRRSSDGFARKRNSYGKITLSHRERSEEDVVVQFGR